MRWLDTRRSRLASAFKRGQDSDQGLGRFPAAPDEDRKGGVECSTQRPMRAFRRFSTKFDAALAKGDIDAATDMFAKDGYWRDLVAFTWNIKTMEGRDQVRDMLAHCLKRVKPRDWRIAEGEIGDGNGGRARSLDFIRDRARARLRPHPNQGRPDLDASDHHGGAQGPRGESRLHPRARREARRPSRRQELEGIARRGGGKAWL